MNIDSVMKISLGVVVGTTVLVIGWSISSGASSVVAESAWSNAPATHVCTTEQMKEVEAQTNFCISKTDYLSSYCYGTAILRNCQKRS